MNLLILSATFPYPPHRGGTQIRTFYLLQALRQSPAAHQITLLTLQEPDITPEQIATLRSLVQDLILFPAPTSTPQGLAKGLPAKLQRWSQSLRSGTPTNVLHYYNPAIQAWIDQAVTDRRFDAITCEHSVNELYIRPEWADPNAPHSIPTILNVHSSSARTLESRLTSAMAEKPWRDRLILNSLRRYESRTYRKFSRIAVTTDDDRQAVQQLTPGSQPHIIPNGVDLEEFTYRSPQAEPTTPTLILTGNFDYFANIDAARWLALDILPQVQQQLPNAQLLLVGAKPDPTVQILAQQPGVKVTGRVPSLAQSLHQASLFVAPMRTGFGIKNKTLEAMAAGIPLIGSDRALEGLDITPPHKAPLALRANSTEDFSAAILQLLRDQDLRHSMAQSARAFIEQGYTWAIAGQRYEALIQEALAHPAPSPQK